MLLQCGKRGGPRDMAFCLEQEKDGNAARCADENAAGAECPRKRLRAAYIRALKGVWQAAFGTLLIKRRRGQRAVPTKTLPARNARANACERHTAVPLKKSGKPHLGFAWQSKDGDMATYRTAKTLPGTKIPLQTLVNAYSRALERVSQQPFGLRLIIRPRASELQSCIRVTPVLAAFSRRVGALPGKVLSGETPRKIHAFGPCEYA